MKIILTTKENDDLIITEVIKVLKSDGLVIFPSDTVYGLLVDATSEKAVKKLIEFKNRPPGKPISVFVSDFAMLKDFVKVSPKQEEKLKQLLPGPFTIILESKHAASKFLESEKGTLGVRIPDYPLITKLVSKLGKPVTATSANLSGRQLSYSIENLLKQLPQSKQKLINLIVDAGKLPRNKPSTIIDLTTPKIKLLRRGDIAVLDSQTFISESPNETKKIAQFVLGKEMGKVKKLLVFIIEGELGVGKTIFVKGIGERLGIFDIVSPTFVIYYEYDLKMTNDRSPRNKFIHVDLYNLTEDEEFEYLGLENYLKPGNILSFEWGEKTGKILETLKQKSKLIYIKMSYLNEKKREIKINY